MPILKKAGRPRRVVTDSEEREILGIYMKCPTNAVAIECMLKKKDKSRVQHNSLCIEEAQACS